VGIQGSDELAGLIGAAALGMLVFGRCCEFCEYALGLCCELKDVCLCGSDEVPFCSRGGFGVGIDVEFFGKEVLGGLAFGSGDLGGTFVADDGKGVIRV
jgi:hypothetical protein